MPDAVGGAGTIDDGDTTPSFWGQVGLTWTWLTKPLSEAMKETFPGPQPTQEVIDQAEVDVAEGTNQPFLPSLGTLLGNTASWVKWIIFGVVVIVVGLVALQILSFIPRRNK